jgi:hypothetical protein
MTNSRAGLGSLVPQFDFTADMWAGDGWASMIVDLVAEAGCGTVGMSIMRRCFGELSWS